MSGCVTGILLIFSFFELWAVVKIFLAKPIRLNPSQSKLLGAKGIDFEVKQSKPKPNVLNTRDMETSLSSCLLNRSLDSPKNGQPLKKSNAQSPTILRNRRLVPFCLAKPVNKLGYVVRMVVDSILPHAKCGPNDHRKDAPPISDWIIF